MKQNISNPQAPRIFEFLIRTSAMSGADLVITVYFTMLDATNTVADEFPHVQFAIIDAVSDRPNVTSLVFEEHVGSYLVGVMAGMLTKVDKVGFVGGEEIPNIRRFEKGFVAGVKAVNADAQVLSGYTGSFEDPGKGKEVALSHYDRGADIVFHAAGKTGEGVISAAKQTGQYVIGVDSDQCYIAPDNMIASMMKMVDVAVFNTIESVVKGEFQPGATNVFGLEARAIGPCRLYPDILNLDEHVDFSGMDEAMEAVQEYRLKILEGEIIVPDAYEDE